MDPYGSCLAYHRVLERGSVIIIIIMNYECFQKIGVPQNEW